jgi:predicted DCC family thiol-disulfide oxidoreductase YuxK
VPVPGGKFPCPCCAHFGIRQVMSGGQRQEPLALLGLRLAETEHVTLLPPNGCTGPYSGSVVAPGHGMLIFDGDCGFCTSSAEWISRGWSPGFEAVAWQHLGTDRLKSLGLTIRDTEGAAWWVDDTGGLFRGHRAIAKGLHSCRGWKGTLGAALDLPPLSWFSAAIYPVVARYRYRLPGGTAACRVTPPSTPNAE